MGEKFYGKGMATPAFVLKLVAEELDAFESL